MTQERNGTEMTTSEAAEKGPSRAAGVLSLLHPYATQSCGRDGPTAPPSVPPTCRRRDETGEKGSSVSERPLTWLTLVARRSWSVRASHSAPSLFVRLTLRSFHSHTISLSHLHHVLSRRRVTSEV